MIYPVYEEKLKTVYYPAVYPKKPIKGNESNAAYGAMLDQYELDLANYHNLKKMSDQAHWNIIGEFCEALAKEYEITDEKKAAKVWGLAWERGHSGGLSEVENYYIELAELAK